MRWEDERLREQYKPPSLWYLGVRSNQSPSKTRIPTSRKQAVVFPSPVEKCQKTSYGLFKGNAHLGDGEKVLSCTSKISKFTHSWYGMMTISKPGISSTTQLVRTSAACLTHFQWGNAPKLPRLCVQRMWSAAVRPGPPGPGMAFFFLFPPVTSLSEKWLKRASAAICGEFLKFEGIFDGDFPVSRLYRYTFWIRLARWGHCRLP